jgi:hypothetical protein
VNTRWTTLPRERSTLTFQRTTHGTQDRRVWETRKQVGTIGRVHYVGPRDTNRYYLRLLLHQVPGATSFRDLRTVDGVVYDTYQQAAQARGLLETDEEFDNDLAVAASLASPRHVTGPGRYKHLCLRKLGLGAPSRCRSTSATRGQSQLGVLMWGFPLWESLLSLSLPKGSIMTTLSLI